VEYIYILECRSPDSHGCMTNAFIYGVYTDGIKANTQKDYCTRQAREKGIFDLEYIVIKHPVIQ